MRARAHSRRYTIVIALALPAFELLLCRSAFAKPATLCVNVGGTAGCFASLSDAVKAVGKSGATINVAFGSYFDNVVVPKTRLTINADPDTAIFGNTSDPIMTVAANAKVTINNLEFQDTLTASSCIESRGMLTLQNMAVFLCSGNRGAAIHQIGGKLTIVNSVINGNEASENGGCLAMEGGQLSLQNVDFSSCDAGGDGGAIWLSKTTAKIVGNSGEAHEPSLSIMSNEASGSGGGVFISGGKISMEAVILSDNVATAGKGGGISAAAPLAITNSVIENNTALDDGGGIFAQPPGKLSVTGSSIIGNNSNAGDGAGIAAETTFSMLNDTLFGNRSSENGGAIFAQGNGKISSLTIDGNLSVHSTGGGISIAGGAVKIANTIVGLNTASGSGADCAGSLSSQGFNLISDTSGCTISGQTASNITGENPNLGATEPFDVKIIQVPNQGSPVLSAGGHCPKIDELLHPRPKNRCDIGAFESPMM
jgi:predicted outer membrane repeat protein